MTALDSRRVTFISSPLGRLTARKHCLSAHTSCRRPRSRRFVSSTMASPAVLSWPQLADMVPNYDFERGPYKSMPSKIWQGDRLFNFQKSDIRVILYRDSGYWCPYCIRVQLLLERKQVPYSIIKENMRCYGEKSPDFLQMVPSGLLPVVKINGRVITESLDIMFEIENQFRGEPYISTLPFSNDDKMQAFHRYVRLERVMAGAWLNMLRGPLQTAGRSVEEFHLAMDIVERSVGEFAGAFFLTDAEEGPGFIDILFAGFLERIKSSVAYWRSIDIFVGRDKLKRWFDAMLAWEPFARHYSDDLTHVLALPPQFGPVKFTGPRANVSSIIDRRRSLHVLNDGSEGGNDREEAAAAIARNADLVISDAMKGTKTANALQDYVDIAFRILVQALMDPGPGKLEALEVQANDKIPESVRGIVASCLRFERGRCCTPRDMSVAALTQFCGAINWLIRSLGEQC